MKPKFGKRKPTKYERENCYCKTHSYRDYDIDIFNDDCGQCFYFYFNNEGISCGTYNCYPEEYIEYVIDHYLDTIYIFHKEKKFYGAKIVFDDHEHTKASLYYHGEFVCHIPIDISKRQQIKDATIMLNVLFSSPEFQKREQERRAKADYYINELMEMDTEEE